MGALATLSQTILAGNFLQKTYPVTWWWDIMRYVCALLLAALSLAYLRIAFGRDRPQSHEEVVTIRLGVLAVLVAMIPACLTEVASIGQPIVPWRLPMYLLMNVFGWWYVQRRL